MSFKYTVCLDMDGVLLEYHGFKGRDHFGEIIPGAIEFVNTLAEKYVIVVATARLHHSHFSSTEDQLKYGIQLFDFLTQCGFKINRVEPKTVAIAYVDDRAVSCRPQDFPVNAFDNALREVYTEEALLHATKGH